MLQCGAGLRVRVVCFFGSTNENKTFIEYPVNFYYTTKSLEE